MRGRRCDGLRRWPELARRPQEQLRAEFAFEQGDALAHGRLSDPEFGGGNGETAALQRPYESAQTIDPVHLSFLLGINHILSIPYNSNKRMVNLRVRKIERG